MPDKATAKPRKQRAVSIASGANIPQIDLDTFFRDRPRADSVAGATAMPLDGAAMTGGGIQAAAAVAHGKVPRSRTVALADGTRITFAAADWVGTLETA